MNTLEGIKLGLTIRELWIVQQMEQADGQIRTTQLANRWVSSATMTGAIDKLESLGIVKRTRSRSDRRITFIELVNQPV